MLSFFFKKKFSTPEDCRASRTSQKLMQKYDYNALHLAILFDHSDWIDSLKNKETLRTQKNHFGLTPIQLALWLNRRKCLSKLDYVFDKKILVEKEGIIQKLTIAEFEKFFQIEYLPHVVLESPTLLQKVLKSIQKADAITSEEKWLGTYFQEEIVQDKNPELFIKWINAKKGYGVLAQNSLKKKRWIGQYSGILRKTNHRKDQKNAYCFEYITGKKYTGNFTIDAKNTGNITRFINHSYQPNLDPYLFYYGNIFHIGLLTNREIKKGEELTYDYGPDYWKRREKPK